ncbi:uncharacterized protein LOC118577426 isoform X2 [Onychomys torridus]|uniref:uncharacterized protein LOC118577426 isoform X2 n=1 Tax=Onychomys torridus TaxID=38674 RepID=UPI00167F22AB|nr:uncharacterized protein LOC118577426 isoform X2 [Onychomys torridus]
MPLPSERPLSHLQVLILQLGTSGDSCSCWQSKPHLADVSAGCRRNVSAAQVHFQIWMNTSTCHIGLLEMYEAQNNACQHTGTPQTSTLARLSAGFSCGVHCVPAAWMLQRLTSPGGVEEAPQSSFRSIFRPAEAWLSALSKGEIVLHSAW